MLERYIYENTLGTRDVCLNICFMRVTRFFKSVYRACLEVLPDPAPLKHWKETPTTSTKHFGYEKKSLNGQLRHTLHSKTTLRSLLRHTLHSLTPRRHFLHLTTPQSQP